MRIFSTLFLIDPNTFCPVIDLIVKHPNGRKESLIRFPLELSDESKPNINLYPEIKTIFELFDKKLEEIGIEPMTQEEKVYMSLTDERVNL